MPSIAGDSPNELFQAPLDAGLNPHHLQAPAQPDGRVPGPFGFVAHLYGKPAIGLSEAVVPCPGIASATADNVSAGQRHSGG